MVAVTFFGTEIFYGRKRHHENKGDQEFKYTEFSNTFVHWESESD